MYKPTLVLRTKNNHITPLEEAMRLLGDNNQNHLQDPNNVPVPLNPIPTLITPPPPQNIVTTTEIQTQTENVSTVDMGTQTDPNLFDLRMLAEQVRARLHNSNNNNMQEYRDEIESLMDLLPPPINPSASNFIPNQNGSSNLAQEIINNVPIQNDITNNIANSHLASQKMRGIEKMQQVIVDQIGYLSEYKLFWATATYLIGYFAYHITPQVFWREFGKYFMKFFKGHHIRKIGDWFKPDKILPNVDFREIIERSYKSNEILNATLKALRKIMRKWF